MSKRWSSRRHAFGFRLMARATQTCTRSARRWSSRNGPGRCAMRDERAVSTPPDGQRGERTGLTRKALAELAAQTGATVTEDNNGHWFVVKVEAPARKKWVASDVHEMVEQCCAGDAKWYAAARADMADRIAYGLDDCLDPDCDWCYPESTEAPDAAR